MNKEQGARSKGQEARSKRQEARCKKREGRGEFASCILHPASCILHLASCLLSLFVLCLCALLAHPAYSDPHPEPVWQALNGPPGAITHLTLDARQPNRLWAVAAVNTIRQDDRAQWHSTGRFRQARAIYHSADGGTTWQPAGNGLPYGDITALAYDALSGQLLSLIHI